MTIPRSQKVYTSALIEVSEDAGQIWLDQLSPADPGLSLTVKSTVAVRGRLAGADLSFRAPIAEIADREGIACYRLIRPRWLKHHQRRDHQRVLVESTVTVYLVDAGAKLVQAELLDISLGGIAAQTDNPGELALSRGNRRPSCTVQLPVQPLQCVLEVRHVRRDEKAGRWLFGGCFLDLSHRHRTALQQFIEELLAECAD